MADVNCAESCLRCASFFEFNVDGDTWVKLYVESGGTEHMARHMWGKFAGGPESSRKHSILNVVGNADSEQGAIIAKMVNQWCKEHPGNRYE